MLVRERWLAPLPKRQGFYFYLYLFYLLSLWHHIENCNVTHSSLYEWTVSARHANGQCRSSCWNEWFLVAVNLCTCERPCVLSLLNVKYLLMHHHVLRQRFKYVFLKSPHSKSNWWGQDKFLIGNKRWLTFSLKQNNSFDLDMKASFCPRETRQAFTCACCRPFKKYLWKP